VYSGLTAGRDWPVCADGLHPKQQEERPVPTKSIVVFLIMLMGAGVQLSAAAADFVPEIRPDPEYLPEEVVGIQMRALASNDQPFENAGIELTFRFASPGNKVQTGPLSKFSGLFNSPAYQPMINHARLEVGESEVRGSKARVPVMVESSDGRQVVYLFMLSRQTDGEFADCWMTDGVTPIRITEGDGPVLM